ncbi:MAG: glycosyltransferase [Verrucomicrobia bacterium]|nr:glycosyltransferase [Verrucomicrobiota bacterium]
MNILHLEASSGWGGQEMRILRESQGMRQNGCQVILGVMKKGLLVEKARQAGFTVYELDFYKRGWIATFVRLLQIIRRHKIDLVNTHSSLDSWIGGVAARMCQAKVVRTRHLSGTIKPGWNSKLLYGSLADFVVTTCESIIPMICTQSGKPRDLCLSVATGVDPEKIVYQEEDRVRFRESLKVRKDQILVGTACFMRSWKGIEDFLRAADQLRENDKIRWVIIGGGHAETYMRKAKDLNLDGIVSFTGHLENPFPALAALDVFALLSTANEGVSQAILQAAYLGKPLVATGTGGLGEVCIHGTSGMRVDPFSPSQVANAVCKLAANSSLRSSLGEAAKDLVMRKFTWKETLLQMECVYKKVLSL